MSKKFENGLRKVVRFSLGTIAFLSFFMMIGSIGAIEQDMVELGTGALRCFGWLGLFGVSFWLVN